MTGDAHPLPDSLPAVVHPAVARSATKIHIGEARWQDLSLVKRDVRPHVLQSGHVRAMHLMR